MASNNFNMIGLESRDRKYKEIYENLETALSSWGSALSERLVF